ncbi:MAG: methyltransferase domain-containing protein [Saprospiraceae bacterium]|nr:methyltransferase domain-containing protein [Saprospiraceae bacterium]
MNFKFLFPTFLNRYLFVERSLQTNCTDKNSEHILHLGSGEGDYDPMIVHFCAHLIACDYNGEDLEFAARRNKDIPNLEYVMEDAMNLSFADQSFEHVIAVEVLEHVPNAMTMLENIHRVLKPQGLAILTFPSLDFPMTYDPLNRVLSWFSNRHLPIGAFAFGHDHLIAPSEFRKWVQLSGFEIIDEVPLSGYLVGCLEAYWTGIVQKYFKRNASNEPQNRKPKILATRPGNKIPRLSGLSRKIATWDSLYFKSSAHSIGKGFVLRKK